MDRDAADPLVEPHQRRAAPQALDSAALQIRRAAVIDPQRRERGDVIARRRVGRRAGERAARRHGADQARRTELVAGIDRDAEPDRRQIGRGLGAQRSRIGRRRRRRRRRRTAGGERQRT